MKKKVLSGIVTTALLCQIVPMSIFADEIKDIGEREKIKIEQKENNIIEHRINSIVTIPDPNLKKALNENLHRDPNTDITYSDLSSLQYINLQGKEISNIEGLQYCTNAIQIWLQDNNISDISPLGEMNGNDRAHGLEMLYLNNNQIEDIAPLGKLEAPKLSELGLANNKINNLEPLKTAPIQKLNTLALTGNKITDISPLTEISSPTIETLYLDGNEISNIWPLGELRLDNLKKISLANNKITDIRCLERLDNSPLLETIDLSNNKIADISVLEKIKSPNLEGIWLNNNQIEDISKLGNITAPKLRTIYLNNNKIQDISPLKKLESAVLTTLELKNQKIVDPVQKSKGIYFSLPNPIKDMDGNPIVPTLKNGGMYVNDNPEKYPNGLLKWNIVGKLANNIEGTVVDLDYNFTKSFTLTSGTKVDFSGIRIQPVEYYKGILPTINTDTMTIRKGSSFNPMNGVSAKDQDDIGDPIKDITSKVRVIQNNVNPYKVGTYIVKYEVTDSWGNTVTKERKVIVADTLMVEEIVGSDRYNTANKISDKWTRADNVVIANSDSIVDAMTASPFAYAKNAPVLLSSKSSLTPETKASIARLQAKTVYIIGGENSLDKNLEKEIRDMGVNVVRIAGKDRFETSLKIAKEVDNISDVSQVAVVNGQKGLPDAISISSPSAINNMPIILSNNAGDIPQGKDFIKSEDLSKAYVIGGNGTVSEKLKNEVSDLINNKPVTRLGGKDRTETNTIVLNEFYKSGALNNLFVVKDGAKREIDLIDSLSVSSLAAKEKSPIMIVGDNLTPEQTTFVKKKTFDKLTRVGGNGNENAFNKIVDLVKK
ncbi:cell wall-binding repeat-containing protein [Romboutsia sp. MSSM.1001216sp_RTP31141st1_G3_RTP31141_220114]|uniref:cell wall-binding repeat-containing protein n=1 Tax=unclassified Romboutsia TaxID=2626894 RepID=UPI0031B5698B